MLRAEHVIARFHRGRVIPHHLSPEDGRVREVAAELCAAYAEHQGRPRAVLGERLAAFEEELGPRLDPRRGYKVVRALAKLLEERAEWEETGGADPYTLRTRLFDLAAALPAPPSEGEDLLEGDTRGELLSQVARETGVEDPAAMMYADRKGEQLLSEFKEPSPGELIERYNTAQAQAVLYSAKELTVDLGEAADARQVFHYVKVLDLIYRLEQTSEGHRLHLDGPLSLFGPTRKYGLKLARFLPGLLLTSPWRLSAGVEWRDREARLDLDSESCGLTTHYSGPSELEKNEAAESFRKAWGRAKDTGGWELQDAPDILPFPERRSALIPDFALVNAESGEVVHLEILGFWSERRLAERLAMIRDSESRGHRVLVAAPEGLGPSQEALSEAAGSGVIPFKTRPDPKAVLIALEGEQKKPMAER